MSGQTKLRRGVFLGKTVTRAGGTEDFRGPLSNRIHRRKDSVCDLDNLASRRVFHQIVCRV